jgi:hypothetical protein
VKQQNHSAVSTKAFKKLAHTLKFGPSPIRILKPWSQVPTNRIGAGWNGSWRHMCAHVGSVGSWVVVDAQSSSGFNVPIQYLQMLRKHRRLASEQSKKKKASVRSSLCHVASTAAAAFEFLRNSEWIFEISRSYCELVVLTNNRGSSFI